MSKPALNGRWYKKGEPEKENVFVERVYKAGYVTGFKYTKPALGKYAKGEIVSPFKATWEELEEQYQREDK